LILDGHLTGLYPETKKLRQQQLAPKGNGILMGVPGMTKEWKGEAVQMP
jgi:hypothetical protein